MLKRINWLNSEDMVDDDSQDEDENDVEADKVDGFCQRIFRGIESKQT